MMFEIKGDYDWYEFYLFVYRNREVEKIKITSYHNSFMYLNRYEQNKLPVNYGEERWGSYYKILPQEKDYII